MEKILFASTVLSNALIIILISIAIQIFLLLLDYSIKQNKNFQLPNYAKNKGKGIG